MFDIGFWEIAVICIIALLVVGPERLPGLIREIARWTRTARRFVSNARREFESQLSSLEEDVKSKVPTTAKFEESLARMDDLIQTAPDRTGEAAEQETKQG